MKTLKLIWKKWMAVGMFIGNIVSGIFLIIFYYTIFAIFAVPFRLFANAMAPKSDRTNWIDKAGSAATLEDYRYEY